MEGVQNCSIPMCEADVQVLQGDHQYLIHLQLNVELLHYFQLIPEEILCIWLSFPLIFLPDSSSLVNGFFNNII